MIDSLRSIVMTSLLAGLFRNRLTGRAGLAVTVVRVVAGLIFVVFSFGKFFRHEQYLEEFASYGLPASSLLIYLVGLLELGGGLALIAGLLTRLAALGLGLNMVIAIVTAGVQVGGPIHLGLAPALAVGMMVLIWAGPGRYAADRQLADRFITPTTTDLHGR